MKPTLLLGLLLATTGCTTLGGNIKGSFSCRAPGGTCAPMATIDSAAVSALGADATAIGTMPDEKQFQSRMTLAGYPGAEPSRSSDRVLKIVFPAHADASGIYREEAVAHVVIERGSWVQNVPPRTAIAASARSSGSLDDAIATQAASVLPRGPRPAMVSGLAEAAAGLSAPSVGSLDPSEDTLAVGMVAGLDVVVGSEDAPTSSAIALARTGHRIGSRSRPVSLSAGAIGHKAETERTRALNIQSLRSGGTLAAPQSPAAPTVTISSRPTGTKDPAEAARRVHDLVQPLLAVPKPATPELPIPSLANIAKSGAGQ